jgi:PAT family beta-lactamase induction signal transducer AmpG
MLSIIVCLIMFVPASLRERPGEKLLPWTTGTASTETKKFQITRWSTIFRSLYKVFTLRNSLLFAIIAFITQGSFNYIDTLLPIFTVQELGWTNLAYSQFYATATLVGGASGMLFGGILIDKFGKIFMLNIYFFMLIALTAGLAFLKMYWINTWFISIFMVVYQVLYVVATIGVFATAMQCCWKRVSATQFTLYMTISNIGRIAGAKLIGPMKSNFNWEYTFLLFSMMIALAWILIRFMRINHQVKRVAELENKDAAK